jgi:signal transduction histidine kinase
LFKAPLTGWRFGAGQLGGAEPPKLLVNATAVPLRSQTDPASIEGTILIIENVTDRVRLEEQLQISDKMASIGLLAAGVAHEVNTPLTGISSFTQMLLEGADPGDPKTKLLEKIESQTFRAAKIVNGSSRCHGPRRAIARQDINIIIADVLALLEYQFETHRNRVRDLCDAPAMVPARAQAAGVPQSVPECQGRYAQGWMVVGYHAARHGLRSSPKVRHGFSILSEYRTYLTRSSRPRRSSAWSWSVDYLRHRPRARWRDRLR